MELIVLFITIMLGIGIGIYISSQISDWIDKNSN
jgi:uncharacterized protein YneF (UPF0154 family)